MGWGLYLLVAVLAAGLGYLGGQVALLHDRRRQTGRTPSVPGEARFALEHVDGQTWAVTNTGDATARLVSVVPFADGVEQWPPQATAGTLSSATSELLPTVSPGGAFNVWLSRHDAGQRVLVSWTSERNVRMGPVVLPVPAPGTL